MDIKVLRQKYRDYCNSHNDCNTCTLSNDNCFIEFSYNQGLTNGIKECIEIIMKIMPSEPYIKNSKHYENWKMKTTELRMVRDIMLEQLKEKKE